MPTNTTGKKKMRTTADMVFIALLAAVICVLAPFSIPIGPVPISITMLLLFLSVYLLGWKNAVFTYLVYLLIGITGLPVFSGWEGGIGKLAGPTGGYLIGFIPMIILGGIAIEKSVCLERGMGYLLSAAGMIGGTIVAYAVGTLWFCYATGTGVMAALTFCVFPFLMGDMIKIGIAVLAGPFLRKQNIIK